MPFHLPALNRRQFLRGTLAAGAGLYCGADLTAAETPTDPHAWALLSDPHIAADAAHVNKGVNMTDNLTKVVQQVLAWDKRPGNLLVDGDLAYLAGTKADYAAVVELVKPIRTAGIPLHLTLGNHDNRAQFWDGLKTKPDSGPAVESKHVSFVPGERANWLMLDSLDVTNKTPGVLGETQLAWLAKTLDQHPDKPALIAVHHHPHSTVQKTPSITDNEAFLKVLKPRKQVKAIIFGHTHHWETIELEGIHYVNLPTIAYPFNAKDPNGWVKLTLQPDGGTFELQSLDTKHALHGDKKELKWRV